MIPDRPRRKLFVWPTGWALLRWTIALLVSGTAVGVVVAVPNSVELWTVISITAVFVSAKVAGWKAGLLATLVCVLSHGYALLSRPEMVYRAAEVLYAMLFAVFAALICWSYARLQSAERAMRRSEEKFRSLVANAPYAICSCTPDGVLLDANPAMAAMLRYASPAQLSQRRLPELYRDPAQFQTLLDEQGVLKQFDAVGAEWKRADNSPVLVRLAGRPIRDQRQQLFFEVVAEDVTERHALEQQFRQAQKMEAIGRLAGGVAHDFNNLLMVISGYSELLLGVLAPDSGLRRPAEEILHAADRAAALTRQLLAFSRKQVQTPRVLDLNGIVAEHLKMLPRLIGEDIKLIFIPGALSATVRVDLSQIQQVIMNLAVNARDAMPSGGKLIIETANTVIDEQIGQGPTMPPGQYVLLTITDTGCGMDAETQSHLFEPFFTTKGQKGTGLGLSTVYGIVKQSSGYIWAESEVGRGATFRIYLPHVAEAGQSAPQELPERRLPQGRETILVVEDEPALRSLARVFLEAHGYTVLDAENGEAALVATHAHARHIDLLLTDVIMPGMNGRELATRLTSERPDLRVLYISGYADTGNGRNGVLEAHSNLLEKPFTSATLARKVREVLESPAAVQAPAQPAAVVAGIPAEGTRAPRYAMRLPLRFRMPGESRWISATTENISRSGVLFRSDRQLSPRAPIELQLTLPVEITGDCSLEVECRGEVVRTIDAAANIQSGLAARILEYQLYRGSPVAQA